MLSPGQPQDEIWEVLDITPDPYNRGRSYEYAVIETDQSTTLDAETWDAFQLWPDANPAAVEYCQAVNAGLTPPDAPEWENLHHDLYIPLEELPSLGQEGPDLAIAYADRWYVSIAAASDAGQRTWPDIAAFLERHADKLETEAAG